MSFYRSPFAKGNLPMIAGLMVSLFLFHSCSKNKEPNVPITCSGNDGIMCTIAGKSGEPGGSGNGGNALDATLYWPMDVELDHDGNILIVDFNNHCIRKIDHANVISRVIGSGILGDSPAGPALSVNLNHPSFICPGPGQTLWMAAWHNWKLKRIDRFGNISSPVGTNQGFSGNGGPANQCQMNLPSSLTFDKSGNIYLSDQGNQSIRKVDTNWVVSQLAGSIAGYQDGPGLNALFSFPAGSNALPGGKMAISPDGSFLIVADTRNHRIRKIDLVTNEVTTIAGNGTGAYSGDGGQALSASLNNPTDVTVAADGTIYIADSQNHAIRKISLNGIITTVAGNGVAGSSPDNTPARNAMLNTPFGVFITPDNTLYIADTFNNQVKKVKNP